MSLKEVCELGVDSQPRFDRVVLTLKTMNIPDETFEIESFTLDLCRAEALVTMLQESFAAFTDRAEWRE